MSAAILVESALIVATVSVAWCLLFTSLAIQLSLYRSLCGLLAALTIWGAMTTGALWTAVLAVIPIGLAVAVPKLLLRIVSAHTPMPRKAVIRPLRAHAQRPTTPLLSVALPAAALAIVSLAPALIWPSITLRQVAGVTLILIGLGIWLARAELTVQVMGWIVMDHALFLFAEPLASQLGAISPALVVLSLYLLIPFTYLLFVLPRLLRNPLGFDADHNRYLRG